MVPVASEVTITLNAGPKMAKVPGGLVGRDIDDVKRDLESAGFTNVDTKAAKKEDPNAQPDEVISVSPKSGTTAALDAKITVTYATGKSPVPDFFGLVESRAVDLARESGFETPEIVNEISPTSTAGTVIRQTPAKGKMVDRTTKIRLVIAQAAPPPTSPPPSTPPVTPPSGSPSPSTSPS
jgi:serine/threonine-protein kinase